MVVNIESDLGLLKLECMAIGSLPHKNVQEAMDLVKKNFSVIPFWPQLAKLNRNEDMIFQFLEKIPGVKYEDDNIYLDNESDVFFEQLEEFFMDFEEIISSAESKLLDKYSISPNNSSTFEPFIKMVSELKPKYAKGQVVGPFTLATTLTDKNKKCAFYDETLREIIVKMLSLKALYQINKIKEASAITTPIIFIDEPSISQLGTSAFITISREEVVAVIKEVSDAIKGNGAMSAIHCCGKCDWTVAIDSGVDIINLDGFFFAQSLSLYAKEIENFMKSGGIIAWGVVPTLDKDALAASSIDSLRIKFDEAIDYLVKKGIDKDLILNNSMVTPSCGAGSLDADMAIKAMDLTFELSKLLKTVY